MHVRVLGVDGWMKITTYHVAWLPLVNTAFTYTVSRNIKPYLILLYNNIIINSNIITKTCSYTFLMMPNILYFGALELMN